MAETQDSEAATPTEWDVFPCWPRDKSPDGRQCPNGFRDAQPFTKNTFTWKNRLRGGVPASAGLVVIDLIAGCSLADVPAEWIETRRVKTPNSYHLLFKARPGASYGNNERKDLPACVDVIRHADGYVILPEGSPGYSIDHDVEPLDAPPEFDLRNGNANGSAPGAVAAIFGTKGPFTIPDGEWKAHHHTAVKYAAHLAKRGLTYDEGLVLLRHEWAIHCKARPGRPGELEDAMRSAIEKYAPGGSERVGAPVDGHISLETVTMRSIEWLEKPLWQRSAFHLLAGVKGSGKGTYTALLGAKITTGLLPGGARNAIYLTSEDSLSIDLKPRLVAAGANIARCEAITRNIKLPDDIPWLSALLETIGDVGLLVIDPVANHIGNRNSNAEAEVRDAIAPLNKLADEHQCTIVGVRHPGKDRTGGALTSILGSTAWVDTPRAVIMIAKDNEDKDVRHIQVVAGNRSANTGGVQFQIQGVMLDGLTEEVTRAVETGASHKDIDDLLITQKPSKSNSGDARELILNALETAPDRKIESDALDAEIAEQAGLKAKTIRNIRASLKNEGLIRAVPELGARGNVTKWYIERTNAPRKQSGSG